MMAHDWELNQDNHFKYSVSITYLLTTLTQQAELDLGVCDKRAPNSQLSVLRDFLPIGGSELERLKEDK